MYLYVRVGSDGELQRFDTIDDVADFLNLLAAGKPLRWFPHGFDTQNYWGSDNISVFWGDDGGNYLESIRRWECQHLERSLDEAEL